MDAPQASARLIGFGIAIGVAVEIGKRKSRSNIESDYDPDSDTDADDAVQAALSGSYVKAPGSARLCRGDTSCSKDIESLHQRVCVISSISFCSC